MLGRIGLPLAGTVRAVLAPDVAIMVSELRPSKSTGILAIKAGTIVAVCTAATSAVFNAMPVKLRRSMSMHLRARAGQQAPT